MGLWGVLLGGVLTLLGTFGAEWLRNRAAERGQSEVRKDNAREFERATLDLVRAAASNYRESLTGYHREMVDTGATSEAAERDLRAQRMAFQQAVFQAQAITVKALLDWERAAVA